MKYVVILGFAIIAALLMKYAAKYRMIILCGFFVVLIGLNARSSFHHSTEDVPLFHPVNQMVYQPDNLENGGFPDGILPYLVEGKTLYTPNDFYVPEFDMDDPNAPWERKLLRIYHGINYVNLFSAWGANVICDEAYTDADLTEEQIENFTELGYINDMMRNSFAVNQIPEEYGNYFHYYYAYCVVCKPISFYINAEGLEDSDELVLLWKGRTDIGYLMSKEYYDREVAQ